MRTIFILWLRQLKKYTRSKSRVIGSLAQPLLYLIAMGYGYGNLYRQAGEGSYIQFLVPGIIGMSVLFTAMFTGIDLLWDKQFGFLKETLVAPVPRFQIMLGRTAGGATIATLQGIIVLALSTLVGFRPVNLWALPLAILFMFLVALFFTALGTAIASTLSDMQGFQLIMNFLIMPTFFLSGALFPLKGLPTVIGLVAKIDPLTYGVDGLRTVLSGVLAFGTSIDLLVLGILTVIVLGIGSYLFEEIQL